MSLEKNRYEATRWLKTAQGDLDSTNILINNGKYAHACFHCHQAGEKALKAAWYLLDADPWGHSITKLIQDLNNVDSVACKHFQNVVRSAILLDRFYIPTRYPNGLPDLTPDESFLKDDAESCIENTEAIIARAKALIENK